MKSHTLIILLSLLMPCTALAQDTTSARYRQHFEIGAGAGIWSSDELFDGYEPGLLGMGKRDYINHQYSGAYHINLMCFISRRISVNVVFEWERESGDWQANYNPDHFAYQTELIGTFSRKAYTLAPEVSYYYYVDPLVKVYCTAGVGVTYRQEHCEYSQDYINYGNHYGSIRTDYPPGDHDRVQANTYLSPVGFSVANRICWFGALGIGYKGILCTGLTVKL